MWRRPWTVECEAWSGLSVSIGRVWHLTSLDVHTREGQRKAGMSGRSRFVWRHRVQLLGHGRLSTFSSPDRLVALTGKCHPTLQRSSRKLIQNALAFEARSRSNMVRSGHGVGSLRKKASDIRILIPGWGLDADADADDGVLATRGKE